MVAATRRLLVLADHTKWGVVVWRCSSRRRMPSPHSRAVISEFCRDLQRIAARVSQAVINLLVRLRVQVQSGLVVPLAYRYELRDAQGKEIIAWHLHDQQGQRYPHLHTRLLPEQYDHVPTGIVGLADIVWMLLDESGVSARRADWRAVLLPLLRRRH